MTKINNLQYLKVRIHLKYFAVPLLLPALHHLLFLGAWLTGNYLFFPSACSVFLMIAAMLFDLPVIFFLTVFNSLAANLPNIYIGEDFFINTGFLTVSFIYWFLIGIIINIRFFRKPIRHFILFLLILNVVSFLGGAMYGFENLREFDKRFSCASTLKQIGLALHQYSMDNDDYYPDQDGAEGFEMLRKNHYMSDIFTVYTCPSSSVRKPSDTIDEKNISYQYRGGQKYSRENKTPVAWDKRYNHKKDYNIIGYVSACGNILLADGELYSVEGRKWEAESEKLDNLLKNKKN